MAGRLKVAGVTVVRWVMRSKIHMATVTDANPDYVGSVTIDSNLIEQVGLWPNEKVLIASKTTGVRLETYVIPGPRGSGAICMNGPAAHVIETGEQVVIMGFELTDKQLTPKVVLVDEDNHFARFLNES